MNSDRLRHRLCALYARATFSGLREFHPSSAARTFSVAVSRVKGGRGGRDSIFSITDSVLFRGATLEKMGVEIALLHGQQVPGYLNVAKHSDIRVGLERFAEKLSRFCAITLGGSIHQHHPLEPTDLPLSEPNGIPP